MITVKYDNKGQLVFSKETKTKAEVLAIHNALVEFDSTMSKYQTFDSMLPHLKASYNQQFEIID